MRGQPAKAAPRSAANSAEPSIHRRSELFHPSLPAVTRRPHGDNFLQADAFAWIPAFAGMTGFYVCLSLQRKRGEATASFARVTGRERCAKARHLEEPGGEPNAAYGKVAN